MDLVYRKANNNDIEALINLAVKSWAQFEAKLTNEHWQKLYNTLTNQKVYEDLLKDSSAIVCTTKQDKIIGMAFLVASGNPTEIYDKDWCYIRLVSVHPDYGGKGIGKELTQKCIQQAKEKGEKIIALHTSEIMVHARHMYEKLGFKILKEIDRRLGVRYWLYTFDLQKIAFEANSKKIK